VDGEAPFAVAAVMECNWAWRRELVAALEIDLHLNFDDASMYGLDWCLQARARGFQVIYDPRAVVHHHLAPRIPELERSDRPRRLLSYCRNYTYIMLKRLPAWRKPVFLFWWMVVGERAAWGLGALAVETLLHGFHWWPELQPAWRGKLEGIRLWLGATPRLK
jgi:GT2 family glycosyltransferase